MTVRQLTATFVGVAMLASTGVALAAMRVSKDCNPSVDPKDFVGKIDNKYLPLEPGTTLVYMGKVDGKPQRETFVVTGRTKAILGVRCAVVRDTVSLNAKPVERTLDWYAQDKAGNVCYFGEDSRDYRNGKWVVSPGSWQAGVDGAQPGIVMEARPRPGVTYRQEYRQGSAEDMASVVGQTQSVTVPIGTFRRVLATREWTPLEPGVVEKRYFARGIGEIRSVVVRGGSEFTRLVEIKRRG